MAKSSAPNFTDLIEDAQRAPASPGRTRDLTSPFGGSAPADHRVVDLGGEGDRVPGATDFAYEAHVDHFVIPTHKVEYEAVLNLILQAKAILRYEDRSITKEGDCIVVICYLTYKPSPGREARLRREAEEERRRG